MVSIPNKNPLALLAEEEQHHLRKLSRMENEMQEVFNKKIELKLKHLKEIDQNHTKDLQAAQYNLDIMKMEIEESIKKFEQQKQNYKVPTIQSVVSPSHSNKSSASTNSCTSNRLKLRFNILDQIKMK